MLYILQTLFSVEILSLHVVAIPQTIKPYINGSIVMLMALAIMIIQVVTTVINAEPSIIDGTMKSFVGTNT